MPEPHAQMQPAGLLLAVFSAILVWSAVRPHDYFTWFLEVFPALIALVILAATWRRFPLTTLAYTLICVSDEHRRNGRP